MNRNIWIGIVVVIALVAGGWWHVNKSSAPTASETTQLPTTRQNTNVGTQPVVNTQPAQNQNPKTVTFNVFFGKENDSSDPTSTLCARAIVRIVPYTSATAQAALVELFKGPTASEKQQGYYSCFFHTDVVVKSLKIENGIATVDFSKEYTEGCGGASSCSQAARNAVKNTLTQFPSIKSVKILIEGAPEGHDA
jgi:spore germination protein GerM